MRIIQLTVDLTDAPRRLAHVVADLPVRPNTTASFTTPLWFCATHMPSGPVGRIAGLFFTTDNGHTVLKWRRDATRTHIYHVDIPSGVTTVRASFDAILKSQLTRRMVMASWEAFMLHPAYSQVSKIPIQATIRIPGNWDYATSLVTETGEAAPGGAYKTIIFKPVSAERLEDSPVLVGQYLSQSNITKDGKHQLCVAFSEPQLLNIPQDRLDKFERLIGEATALLGPGPYQQYKFLSVSSDILVPGDLRGSGGGIEHAESCHLITSSRVFADLDLFDWVANVFSHEYFHVWNGKYRRPAGHVPSDFTAPLDDTLLWVYEGLTQYYGLVLAARSGLSAPSTIKTKLALAIANMQCQSGRGWRSTEDTAIGVPLKVGGSSEWGSYVRGFDYYDEGVLLWLDADTLIRERSHGAKSLDDFARQFFDAAGATKPLVVPYTLNEVVSTLDETLPFDWARFFRERVQTPQAQVNTDGFERAGYRFSYTLEPIEAPVPVAQRRLAVWHSLGMRVDQDGKVVDVQRFSRADEAGLAPSQKITHVGGNKYSLDELTAAIESARDRPDGKVQLSLEGDEESWDAEVKHSSGLVYPVLKPHGKPDMLAHIFASRAARQ
ncbi:hypothetical protein BM221_005093 [Beauveria bassiana]|uniref:Peptidase M61 domain-containing protein n=1 Tax=Beauveria bassiana TaxID=176275 RepID=A0A2N6NMM7_BEABA|nr:hypothetical protein BM221_005093 [Beauveria bassiana]